MASETVLVRPRTGIILAGIPRSGAHIPRELAEEWIANRLVVRLEPEAPKPKPTVRRSPRGSGASRPRKRRRT